MQYASRQDMAARFGSAAVDRLAADSDTTLDTTLAEVSSEMDSHLAEGYDLPLPAGAYPVLTGAACDLARARLYQGELPDAVRNRASRARRTVQDLAAGTRTLIGPAGPVPRRRGAALAQVSASGPARMGLDETEGLA